MWRLLALLSMWTACLLHMLCGEVVSILGHAPASLHVRLGRGGGLVQHGEDMAQQAACSCSM